MTETGFIVEDIDSVLCIISYGYYSILGAGMFYVADGAYCLGIGVMD